MEKEIIVERQGISSESYMKTIKIEREYQGSCDFIFDAKTLSLRPARGRKTLRYPSIGNPKSITLACRWKERRNLDQEDRQRESNNILGSNSLCFFPNISKTVIKIPIIAEQDLIQFGCLLFKDQDIFNLYSRKVIYETQVDIGKDYIKDYIMQPTLGEGIYLECHDAPHIHVPLTRESTGYLILGHRYHPKEIALGAFRIPFGMGVYTPNGVIHNDCFLIGSYKVFYTVTDKYSTVLLRNKNKELVSFIFE